MHPHEVQMGRSVWILIIGVEIIDFTPESSHIKITVMTHKVQKPHERLHIWDMIVTNVLHAGCVGVIPEPFGPVI